MLHGGRRGRRRRGGRRQRNRTGKQARATPCGRKMQAPSHLPDSAPQRRDSRCLPSGLAAACCQGSGRRRSRRQQRCCAELTALLTALRRWLTSCQQGQPSAVVGRSPKAALRRLRLATTPEATPAPSLSPVPSPFLLLTPNLFDCLGSCLGKYHLFRATSHNTHPDNHLTHLGFVSYREPQ